MIIFAPILLHREPLDWESGRAFTVLARFLEELSRFSARRAGKAVVTDSRVVARAADALAGIDVHFLDGREAADPLGCIADDAAGRVVVKVDFHSGLLDAGALFLALARFEEDPTRLLAAVAPADDNPVQLNTYCTVEDSGFLHLMDTPEQARRLGRGNVPARDHGLAALSVQLGGAVLRPGRGAGGAGRERGAGGTGKGRPRTIFRPGVAAAGRRHGAGAVGPRGESGGDHGHDLGHAFGPDPGPARERRGGTPSCWAATAPCA